MNNHRHTPTSLSLARPTNPRLIGILALFLLLAASVSNAHAERLSQILKAIRAVETGGNPSPAHAIGDGGRSFGPYQISQEYWLDAGAICDWDDIKKTAVAEKVMVAYWKRYCPDALKKGDAATLARIHNGGPNGLKKKSATDPYCQRVLAELNRLKYQTASR